MGIPHSGRIWARIGCAGGAAQEPRVQSGRRRCRLDQFVRAGLGTARRIECGGDHRRHGPSPHGGGDPNAGLEAVLPALAKGSFDAAIINVSSELVERSVQSGVDRRDEWPRIMVATVEGNLQSVLGAFRSRVVGFSAVVPNPEASKLVVARELEADAEKYANAHAITFDGMEAYIAARVLVKALRKAPSTARLQESLAAITNEDFGGFFVSFAKGRESGSTWVDVGVRAGSGALLR
jgi:branched-chain amino acid transport system substrate-binding protein